MNILSAFAIGGVTKVGDREFHFTPLSVGDLGEARVIIRTLTPDPMEGIVEICNQLHPEVAKVLISEARAARDQWGSLTSGPGASWAGTIDGCAFFMHRCTRKHHPELTMEDCANILYDIGEVKREALMQTLAEMSGLSSNPTRVPSRKNSSKKKRKAK